MLMVDYEGEASGSFFNIKRHIDMFDLAKVVEGADNCLTSYIEVNIMNKELRIGVWVLFTCVGRLLFCHIIVNFIYFYKFRWLFLIFSFVLLAFICLGSIAFLLYELIRRTCCRDLGFSGSLIDARGLRKL